MIIHLLLTTKMHRKMHQNEELLQIDCSMEKEEGERAELWYVVSSGFCISRLQKLVIG